MPVASTSPSRPSPDAGSRPTTWSVSLAVLTVGLLGTVGLASCGDGGDAGGVGALVGASVRLEPLAEPQPDPFVDKVLDPAAEAGEPISLPSADPPQLDGGTSTALSGQVAEGTGTGLYGGSLEPTVCDVDDMVAFHSDPANSAVTAAFAEVQGITAAQVVDYIRSLAPVRLRYDTRVTNHGYVDGAAEPFQSVLQAGTAVLVDATGVPRVKCFCGNPLVEPQPISGASDNDALDVDELAENPDDRWEGFDPESVVAVEPGDPTGSLTVVDLETGEPREKPVGSGSSSGPDGGTPPEPTATSTTSGGQTVTTAPSGGGGSGGTRCVTQPDGDVICYAD